MMHPDRQVSDTLDGWEISSSSSTHLWVNEAFATWDEFYGYFETMFEGHSEPVALNLLHNGESRRCVPAEDGSLIRLSTLAGAPGAVRHRAQERGDEYSTAIAAADRRELLHCVARFFTRVGYTMYHPDEKLLIPSIGFMVIHGDDTTDTIFSKHALAHPEHVNRAHYAIKLGVPIEYIRDTPSIFGHGTLAELHRAGVPAEYVTAFKACDFNKLDSSEKSIADLYRDGIDPHYVLAAVDHVEGYGDPRLTLKTVMQAARDGIPLEYLLA